MFKNKWMIFAVLLLFPFQINAQTDDSLEETALELADGLSCTVCSDPHIEQATDETAEDVRFFIRKNLKDGKSVDAVKYLVLSAYEGVIVEQKNETPPKEDPEWISFSSAVLFFGAMGLYLYHMTRSRHEEQRRSS